MNFKNKCRYQYAVIRAALPELRVALRGGEVSEERYREELKRQLEARGLEYTAPYSAKQK